MKLLPGEEESLFELMGAAVSAKHLAAGHITLLALVLAQIARGAAFGSGTIEGSGLHATLVVDARRRGPLDGIVNLDADGDLHRWQDAVKWLAKYAWLTLDRDRATWRIGLGNRTLRALRAKR